MLVCQNNFKSEIKTIWYRRANMSLECREDLEPEAKLESKCAEARSAKDRGVHPKGRAEVWDRGRVHILPVKPLFTNKITYPY